MLAGHCRRFRPVEATSHPGQGAEVRSGQVRSGLLLPPEAEVYDSDHEGQAKNVRELIRNECAQTSNEEQDILGRDYSS